MNVSLRAFCVPMAVATLISANAAGGMHAAVAQSEPAATTAQMAVTVSPAAPQAGDNTIDLMITDVSGKPLSGLKLTAQVEMTTMNMGIAHPDVKDMGDGRYRVGVSFGMSGPWRVTISAGGAKSIIDFEAGSQSAWKPRTVSLAIPATKGASAAATSPAAAPPKQDAPAMAGMPMPGTRSDGAPARVPGMQMPGMTMPGAPAASSVSSTGPGFGPNGKPTGTSDDMAGMDMPGMKTSESGMKMGGGPYSMDAMTPLKMPQLQEQGTYIATGRENWNVRTGFGKNAGMVAMMSQMMVGGSGMEGMKMPSMKMNFDKANFMEDPDVDTTPANTAATSADQKPSENAPPPTTTTTTHVAPLSVPALPAAGPMAAKSAPASTKTMPLKIAASIASPKSGDNAVTITVTDATGAPVTGATIATSVAMTSMDMGTSHPLVKEIGGGKYRAIATFSMAGPWRIAVNVTPSGGSASQKAAFDFTAK